MNTRMSMCMEQNIDTVQRAVTHMTMSIYKASQFILMSTLTGSMAMQTISMKSTITRMLRNFTNIFMRAKLTFTTTPTARKLTIITTITSIATTPTSCTCWMKLP